MTDLLLTLGTLTLGGAVAILLFALASRASRVRYGARWRCGIWVLLCLRLVIPFSFFSLGEREHSAPIQFAAPSDTVIFEYTPSQAPDILLPSSDPTSAEPSSASPVVSEQPQPQTPTQTDETLTPEPEKKITISLSQILFSLWLAGMAIMAIWVIFSHLRFLRYLRRWSRPTQEAETIWLYNQLGDQLQLNRRPNLRTCAGLKAPMLSGLLRPVLLLPEDTPQGDTLRYTLIHELTHFKRRDIWMKGLALLTNVVHWFNPFMWYMVRLVERDTELACDEAALRQLPYQDHAAYGRTILEAVERMKQNEP